ncbi:MAG: GNAT family N-acetyltransferase [candidate division Zixibacteria bacterium]|nr:GNAT family N-acetyltransferase [candidate division Zixibacteria bacterium]
MGSGAQRKDHPKSGRQRSRLSADASVPDLEFHPLTIDRWKDLEELFGERGAVGGCWCMWWRLKRSEFERRKGKKNKAALKRIVKSGQAPGILAYSEGRPIAWCSIGPRETFPRLESSRLLKSFDDKPVWSVVCFFVARHFRWKGISVEILKASVDYAKKKGARIVEGYPIDPRGSRWPGVFVWTALPSTFLEAGFKEVHRASPTRPIMRYFIKK